MSPALFVIGLTAQMALIHLDTLTKDRIPKGDAALAGSILVAKPPLFHRLRYGR